MLSGVNSGLDVHGPEAGRGGQDDDVHAAVDDLFVGVQTDKNAALVDIDLAGMNLLDAFKARIGLVLKRLPNGP